MVQACLKHVQCMSKSCLKHVPYVPRKCLQRVWRMSKTYYKRVRQVSKPCLEHLEPMINTCDVSENMHTFVHDVGSAPERWRIRSRHHALIHKRWPRIRASPRTMYAHTSSAFRQARTEVKI